ncbi:MAG: hypothetical protein P4L69_05485 [Desulfosporosinus sp.]|nr:hypothetical protein [Desulfosporosinus sp.]
MASLETFEEAMAEQYVTTGNILKTSHQLKDAADAYIKAANYYHHTAQLQLSAQILVNAANCLRKIDHERALECLHDVVDIHKAAGNFSIVAKYLQEMAELCETNNDIKHAGPYYAEAAVFYDGENAKSRANQCLSKVAMIDGLEERYDHAIELFEIIARASLQSDLLKWGAKNFLLKATLCHLAKGDIVGAKQALVQYQIWDASFGKQRECMLATAVADAYEHMDEKAFTQAVVDYDVVTTLEPWLTTMLLRIKSSIKEDPLK